jgi:large repetitive protein
MGRSPRALLLLGPILGLLASCGGRDTSTPPAPSAEQRSDELIIGTCRANIVTASRSYVPAQWDDGEAEFAPPIRVRVPDIFLVIHGNAGNGLARFEFVEDGVTHTCAYRGGAKTAHPTNPLEILRGLRYVFESCDDGSVPGDILTVTHVTLHVQTGDQKAGTTTIVWPYLEVPPCGRPTDGGVGDGGTGDGGIPDGGAGDAGSGGDGGTGIDAGTPDAGPDGGVADGGTPDGGPPPDTTPPTVTLRSPASGTITQAISVPVVLSATDDRGVVSVTAGATSFVLGADGFYRATLALAEGTNVFDIVALDAAGNAGHGPLLVTRDSTAPNLVVTSPADGAHIGASSVTVTGTVQDATAVAVTVNGTPVSPDATGAFSTSVALVAGSNSLSVTAVDAAGNASTVGRAVRSNTVAPVISVDAPADGSTTTDGAVNVRGTVTPGDSQDTVTLTLNGTNVPLVGTSFSASTNLALGANSLNLHAVDTYGLAADRAITVTRTEVDAGGPPPDAGGPPPDAGTQPDAGGPPPDAGSGGPDGGGTGPDGGPPVIDAGPGGSALVLAIASPFTGAVFGSASVPVTGQVQGGTPPYALTVGGRPVSVAAAGSFAASLTLPEGDTVLAFQLTDARGQTVSDTRAISVDRTPPLITLTRPTSNPAAVTESPYLLQGTASDSHLAEVRVNGVPVPTLAGGFSSSVTLPSGETSVLIEAVDLAGNRSSLTQVFSVSGIPPSVTILSPADGSESPTAVASVRARVQSSTPLASVQIATAPATSSGDGEYTADVPLSLGDNVIPVIATDTSGLSGSASVRVHYRDVNQEPLAISGVSPLPGADGVETDALVSVAFNKPIVGADIASHFTVSANGAPLQGGYSVEPGAQTVTFVNSGPLPTSARVTVSVSGIQAQTGPGQQNDFSSDFTVRRPLTSLRGQVTDEQQRPLAGATVQVVGQSLRTQTGADGNYTLFGVTPGVVSLRVEAVQAPGGDQYPAVERKVLVQTEQTNSAVPLILFPSDPLASQFLDGSVAAHLTFNGRHGPLAIDLPPYALSFADGSTVGLLTVTQIPSFALPVPLSARGTPAVVWRMEPAGTRVQGPVSWALPNNSGLPPGRLALFLTHDPSSQHLQRTAFGRVSPDGTAIVVLTPVPVGSFEYFGYVPLDEATSNAVDAALAGTLPGPPDGGKGARLIQPRRMPFWERVLGQVIGTAHAQVLLGVFTAGMTQVDQYALQLGASNVFGRVRTPRLRQVVVELSTPPASGSSSFTSVAPPYALPVDFTARLDSADLTSDPSKTLVAAQLTANGPNGQTLAPPPGAPAWSASGLGQVHVSSSVQLLLGKNDLFLTGSVGGQDTSTTHLQVELKPGLDGGVNPAQYSVTQLEDASQNPDLVAGAVAFANVRVVVTSDIDQAATTGPTGGYGMNIVSTGGDAIACAEVPIGPRAVPRKGPNGATRYEFVPENFLPCSVAFSISPGLPSRADILVDARAFNGELRFANRDGTAVPNTCSQDPSSPRVPDGGYELTGISDKDIGTTEVHFFREDNLEQPIAKFAYVVPHPDACSGGVGGGQSSPNGSFIRVRAGPTNPAQRAAQAQCRSLDGKSRTPTEDIYWKVNCANNRTNFLNLNAGDRLVVFAINHATGYAGQTTITVPPVAKSTVAPGAQCPEDVAMKGPLVVQDGAGNYTISRCTLQSIQIPVSLTLYPPEIDVRVKRQAGDLGVDRTVPFLVRTGGGATTRDDFIAISTHWRVRTNVSNAGDTSFVGKLLEPDCKAGLLPDGGLCVGRLVDVGPQGPLLERYCSELGPAPTADELRTCLKDDTQLVDVPAGVPGLKGRVVRLVGSAAEQPAVSQFDVLPGAASAAVQAGQRIAVANGATQTNNLLRANYYVQLVGFMVGTHDLNGDGVLQPNERATDPAPGAFVEGPTPGLPAAALALKNVYSSLGPDGGASLRYDVRPEHEFRVFEVKDDPQVLAFGADGGVPMSLTPSSNPLGPSASPSDTAYQLLLTLLEPTESSRAGTIDGSFQVRIGSDAYGFDCDVKVTAGAITGDCAGEPVLEVLTASDLLYLEVYLKGNAANALWRYNFYGLSPRKDLLTASSQFTANNATTPQDKLDSDGKFRPISQAALANFFLTPGEITAGTMSLCIDDSTDCTGSHLFRSYKVTQSGDGFTLAPIGDSKAPLPKKLDRTGDDQAVFYALALDNTEASVPGMNGQAHTIIQVIEATEPRQQRTERALGKPKGLDVPVNAKAMNQPRLGDLNLADGHLSFDHTDFSLPEFSGQVGFVRTYNNQLNEWSPLGLGWTHGWLGYVQEEALGRYSVVIGGQSYDFPSCAQVDADSDVADKCVTDRAHGGQLTVAGKGDAVGTFATFTMGDGRRYRFGQLSAARDAQAGKPSRRRWMLTEYDDGHADGGGGAYVLKYVKDSDLVQTVSRSLVTLTFSYTPVALDDSSIPLQLKLLARRDGFQLLTSVQACLSSGGCPYRVDFTHDSVGNLLSAATTMATGDVASWAYHYQGVVDPPADRGRFDLANELDLVELSYNAVVQRRYVYARTGAASPAPHVLPQETITSMTLPGFSGKSFEVTYAGTVRTVTRPDGTQVQIDLNTYGNPDSVTVGGLTTQTTWESDTEGAKNAPTRVTSPSQGAIGIQLDDRLRPMNETLSAAPVGSQSSAPVAGLDVGGATATYATDTRYGDPVATQYPTASGAFATRNTTLNLAGDLTDVTVLGGDGKAYFSDSAVYDATGIPQSRTDPTGRTTTYSSPNGFGLPTVFTHTQASGGSGGLATYSESLAYDALGRLVSRSNGATGAVESTTYDGFGRVTRRFVAGNPSQTWSYTFTMSDNAVHVVETLNGVFLRSTDWQDGLKLFETFSYGTGQLATRAWTYDAQRIATYTDEVGTLRQYAYDPQGRLTSISIPAMALTERSWTYDPDGNLLTETDDLGIFRTLSYDNLGRLREVRDVDGQRTAAVRDSSGQLATMDVGRSDASHLVNLNPDPLGRPLASKGVSAASGVNMVSQFDLAGRVIRQTDQELGLDESFAYDDALGRVTSRVRTVRTQDPSGTPLTLVDSETREYSDNGAGTTVTITRKIDTGVNGQRTETRTLTLDQAGRLLTSIDFGTGGAPATTTYTYDRFGHVATRTVPGGGVFTNGYDDSGYLVLTKVPDTGGEIVTAFTTDAAGRVLTQIGPHGFEQWTNHYDPAGRLDSRVLGGVNGANGGSTPAASWAYAYGSGTVQETGPDGIVVTRAYNTQGKVTNEIRQGGTGTQVTAYAYEAGQLKARVVTEGSWSLSETNTLDDRGRVLDRVEQWSAPGAGYTYETVTQWAGQTAAVQDTHTPGFGVTPFTRKRTVTVDSLGNRVRQIFTALVTDDTSGSVIDHWVYDAAGRIALEAAGGRPATRYLYQEAVLASTVFANETTTYAYSPDRLTLTVTEPQVKDDSGQSISRQRVQIRDFRGMLLRETYGVGSDARNTVYTYDGGGFLTSTTTGGTQDEKTWAYEYGPRGEILSTKQPDGIGIFTYGHDARANLTRVHPPSGSRVPDQTFAYDYLGRLSQRARESTGGTATWSTTWAAGVGTTLAPAPMSGESQDKRTELLDGRGRLAQLTLQPGTGSTASDWTGGTYAYDGDNLPVLTRETYASQPLVTVTYGYDGRARPTSVARTGQGTVSYAYQSGFDQLDSVASPSGSVFYEYNDATTRRLSTVITQNGAGQIDLTWEAGGQRLLTHKGGGLAETRCWDARGRLKSVTQAVDIVPCDSTLNATVLSQYVYDYDNRDNRTSQEFRDGTLPPGIFETTESAADGADRLVGTRGPLGTTLWKLAPDGTRIEEKHFTAYSASLTNFDGASSPDAYVKYTHDVFGGLKSVDDALTGGTTIRSYTTDAVGRRRSDSAAAVTRTYGWDAAGRLTKVTVTAGSAQTYGFGYDAAGLRRSRTGPQPFDAVDYLWGGGRLLEEGGKVYAHGGEALLQTGDTRVGEDVLGSVVQRQGGTLTGTSDFDAWGNYRVQAGRFVQPSTGLPTAGFAGTNFESALGLHYAQQRWYDPSTGSWLSMDPVGATPERLRRPAGLNPSLYGAGNPARFTDPRGTFEEPVHGALTYHLAILAGFPADEAATIALATAGVDHDPRTRPTGETTRGTIENFLNGTTEEYHFQVPLLAKADVLIEALSPQMDLKRLGIRLHTLEDVGTPEHLGPHKRGVAAFGFFGLPEGGHPYNIYPDWTFGFLPRKVADQPYHDPVANALELKDVYQLIRFAAHVKHSDAESDDEAAYALIERVVAYSTETQITDFLNAIPLDGSGKPVLDKNGKAPQSYVGIVRVNFNSQSEDDSGVAWTPEQIDSSVGRKVQNLGITKRLKVSFDAFLQKFNN